MSAQSHAGTTAIVTGASRGFGRGIAVALAEAGADVVGVARDQPLLEELRAQLGDTFTPVVADVADPVVAQPAPRSVPPPHARAQRRGEPGHAATDGSHLADLQPRLGGRRPAGVPLDARGAAASAR